jgi:lysine 2,3-aminomutase
MFDDQNHSSHSIESFSLPVRVTPYYKSLAASLDPVLDPLAAQFIPQENETIFLDYETADPLSDNRFLKAPRLIHHYPDRVLILANDSCALYCRHCFRRHFTGNDQGKLKPQELSQILNYLTKNPEIKEILLSGGDPLMLSDNELFHIIDSLKNLNPEFIIRIGTRVPVVLPYRINEAFLDRIKNYSSIWMVIQTNHPREITFEFSTACRSLIKSGISLLNQSVLLKGINNSFSVLENLFRSLLQLGIKPYYLFQADLASGTRHFRTSIEEGLNLMNQLRRQISGMAIPIYAVDLPNGGGKVPLHEGNVKVISEQFYEISDLNGNVHQYPREL